MKIKAALLITVFLCGCVAVPIKFPCYPVAAKQFLVWNKSKGKELKGLTARRQKEMQLFMRGCKQ